MGLLTRRFTEEINHLTETTPSKRIDYLNTVTGIFVIGLCQQSAGEVTFSAIQRNGLLCWNANSGAWSNKEHVSATFGVLDYGAADHVGGVERGRGNLGNAHGGCYS